MSTSYFKVPEGQGKHTYSCTIMKSLQKDSITPTLYITTLHAWVSQNAPLRHPRHTSLQVILGIHTIQY